MYFVYILGCLDTRRTYVGHTDDLMRRYRMHREGSTRTTRERFRNPVVLHLEMFSSRPEAMQRKRYFKQGAGHRLRHRLADAAFALFRYPQSKLLLVHAISERPGIGANTSIDRTVRDLEPFAEWNEVSVTARQTKLGSMAREIWNIPNPEVK